ncbi:MAG TPA: amino acid adenylation domain-containing protein [Thermoanaerobaculia bacterium]|nr:amino acid adenylation domain-containing protein [Thermoanaerobaculia bacterium]
MSNILSRLASLPPEKQRQLLQKIEEEGGAANAFPLSFSQERLWFLDQLAPGGSVYNMPAVLRFAGRLDVAALARSRNEIVRRHEALRTAFPNLGAQPIQVVLPDRAEPLPVIDLSGLAGTRREAEAREQVLGETQRPFDLARGPLLRMVLLHLSTEDHLLTVTMHHIVSDAWSVGVFLSELAALYAAFQAGRRSPLPEPRVQLRDFVLWQRRQLQGDRLEAEIEHWRRRLQEAPAELDLPADRPRPPVQSFHGASWSFRIPGGETTAARHLSSQHGATLFMTLLAAFEAQLLRYTGREDLVIGTVVAQRDRPELEGLMGFLINTLVLRTDLAGDPAAAECLERVRETVLEAHAHQNLPFEKLVEVLQPERSLGRSPLFQVAFGLQTLRPPQLGLPGLRVSALETESRTAKLDLRLAMVTTGDGLEGTFEYATDLFDEARIARMADHLRALLGGMVADPARPLSCLEMLTEAERHQLLREWNDTEGGQTWQGGAHERFARQVERTPDHLAVVFEAERLTYRDLERRANLLASSLRRRNLHPESLVGLCLERSVDMIVAVLAVLKAGAAYLPLDPTNPPDRLSYMLEDARVSLLLTGRGLEERLPPSGVERLLLEEGWETRLGPADGLSGARVEPDSLAYVIYTSGSTGRPKGVGLTHAGLCNHVDAAVQPGERVLQFSFLSFDASVSEIFMTLLHGATLVLARQESMLPGPALAALLREQAIDMLTIPPSALAVLPEEPLPDLRILIVAGEVCGVELAERWGRGRWLFNAYGPTEAAICATYRRSPAEGRRPDIGHPILNARTHVLDSRLQVVPVGVPGELHIGGLGVGREYLGRPAETAAKFIPDPFSMRPGDRLYKTGDLARYLPDGSLEFLGRIDQQIKLRGFRIEPGEIEAVLREHPAVEQAAVLAREGRSGEKRLVAYVAPRPPQGEEPSLKGFLAERLARYMVPSAFVWLDELPRNSSGKLDRSALPDSQGVGRGAAEEGSLVPRTGVERAVAGVWQEVLGVERVAADDNFFDLGGHSLLLARVHGRLRTLFDADLALIDLFAYPTVNALASRLEELTGTRSPVPELPEEPSPEPLSAADRGSALAADSAVAVIGLAVRVPGALSPKELWRNLCAGVESIQFPTDEELLALGASPDRLRDPRYVKARSCLDGIDRFDADFFRLSPMQAALMDPQQRFFLECAWEALENAGYGVGSPGRRTGVYAGKGANTYLFNLLSNPEILKSVGLFQAGLGNEKDHLTTRVSYQLDLEGPSVTVQTACSTSLVAVHLACQGLLGGECDMALAGGVSIDAQPQTGYLYQDGGINSPDGHCRPFDAEARGTISACGVGIVVLKRLRDAVADGDTIHAVIRGSAINNDGAAKVGYTAPRIEGQARVIRDAQRKAGVRADDITYVEAHGTATELGDPIEIAALTQAFRATTGRTAFCALGSIKSNLGHCDTASGVVGLIKTVLCLENGALPPSLHFRQPNPRIDLESSPFYVNAKLAAWERGEAPRRAGVSSFGIGGTNAHVVLEEAPEAPAAAPSRPWQLLMLSARTDSALETATSALGEHLRQRPDAALADVAYTLQVGRSVFSQRRVVVCRDAQEAVAALGSRNPERVFSRESALRNQPCVFLFPGQGSQHVCMGRELYEAEPVFRGEVDRACDLLHPALGLDLREILDPREMPAEEAARRLGSTALAQPALFVIEHALARLWMSWLGAPAALLGHSLGEYVAACLAGVLSLEQALALVAARGRLMEETRPGAMLAVPLGEEETLALSQGDLGLAAVNGPSRCVVSGPVEAVNALQDLLARKGLEGRRLPTSRAFHSSLMEPILEPFAAEVRKIGLQPPRIPYISNLTGTWITAEQATDPAYWSRHLRQPVRFEEGLRELWRSSEGVLLEAGPGRTLTALAGRHPDRPSEREVLPSLGDPRESGSDLRHLLTTLGRLWLAGVNVDWPAFYAGECRRRIPLPTYPFEGQRYWIEAGNGGGHSPALSAARALEEAAGSWQGGLPRLEGAWLVTGGPAARSLAAEIARSLSQGMRVALAGGLAELRTDPRAEAPRLRELEEELGRAMSVEWMSDREGLEAALDWLCCSLVLDYFQRGGVPVAPGQVWHEEELRRTLRIAPGFHRFLDRLLAVLLEGGLLSADGPSLLVLPAVAEVEPAEILEATLSRRYPEYAGLVRLLTGCVRRYGETLSGDIPAIEVLYPQGKRSTALDEDDSPRARQGLYIELLCRFLVRLADDHPDRELRILEVGAGTGVLTRAVLAALAGHRVSYTFTDIGRTFVRAAELEAERQSRSDMSFRVLDISADPVRQGFAEGAYDAVLGFNVVHATADLGESVGHLQRLLVPGGVLALVEPVKPAPWIDLIWGLADGWWSFTDQEIRQLSPLVDLDTWERTLRAQGLESVVGFPEEAERSRRDFGLILGRKSAAPAEEPRDAPLVLASQGLGAAVREARQRLGALHGVLSVDPGAADLGDLAALVEQPGLEVVAVSSRPAGSAGKAVEAFLATLAAQPDSRLRLVRWEESSSAPEITPAAKPAPSPGSVIEIRIAEIWRDLLGTPLGLHDNFFEKGADSLAMLSLTARIRDTWRVDLPLRLVLEAPTVAQLAAKVGAELDRRVRKTSQRLVEIQPGHPEKVPFFTVHAAGGNVLCYYNLARHLGSDRPVYALQAPGVEQGEEEVFTRLEDLATHHVSALRTLRPHGPYLLGGWSAGGTIAFEMAQQLQRMGEEVLLVALMDTYAPQVSEGFDELQMLLWQAWRFNLSMTPEDFAGLPDLDAGLDRVVDLAMERGAIPPAFGRDQARRLLVVEMANLQAILDYRAEPYPGRLSYFRCTEGTDFGEFIRLFPRINEMDHAAGWTQFSSRSMPVFDIPGDHSALMDEPAVGILARHLGECFAEVEREPLVELRMEEST